MFSFKNIQLTLVNLQRRGVSIFFQTLVMYYAPRIRLNLTCVLNRGVTIVPVAYMARVLFIRNNLHGGRNLSEHREQSTGIVNRKVLENMKNDAFKG
jgi:hypothetical protein